MRIWLGKRYAPIERPRLFSLKGGCGLTQPSWSNDLAHIDVEYGRDHVTLNRPHATVTPDFARSFRGVENRDYAICPIPLSVLDAYDVEVPVPSTLELPLPVLPHVSENLLRPLAPGVPSGKDYRGQQPRKESQRTFFGEASVSGDKTSSLRKAYRPSPDGSGTSRYMLDIWDLLFPLLKPPLRIDAPSILDLPGELYPFQIEGVKRLVKNRSFLLADEMGTGKTVITSVALRILFHQGLVRRALIVCPKSILGVWDTHLRDWASTLRVTVVHGSQDVRRIDWRCPAHIYVTTYGLLRSDTKRRSDETTSLMELASGNLAFDAVVLDEAHAIKNPTRGRAKAVREVSKRAKYRWALTGTPIQNGLKDLRSIFQFVRPSLFPKMSVPVSAHEASSKIRPYFLRRLKRDVFPELPDKILSDAWLDLDHAQQAEYDKTLLGGQNEFRSGEKVFSREHVFVLLGKLKQICNFASGMGESPKSLALLEQVEEIVANEKKVLVFTQYLEEGVKKLERILEPYGVVSITGHSSDKARANAIERFQTDPSIHVFLATRTTREGVTLTAASYVVHFDHWWNPADVWQAEDRAHRMGQKETVNVYSYWMRDTVEERIRSILQRKGLLHGEVIDSLSESDFEKASTLTVDDLLEVLDMDRGAVQIPEAERLRPQAEADIGEVFERLNTMDPFDFEEVVKRVFQEALGYVNARVTKRSADGGIDVEATRTVRGQSERIVIQCKRTPMVGPNIARELLGVLSADPSLSKGFLVTSGRLTRACRDFCQKQGRLEGIDGFTLAKWVHDHKIGTAESNHPPLDEKTG